jgi:hypothetical protein
MKDHRFIHAMCAAALATSAWICTPATGTAAGKESAPLTALWDEPRDLENRDLFNGPWGAANAPDPKATYTFVRPKQGGVNPGVVVKDPSGRKWDVKQAAERWDEGPSEVVLSRVLWAVGYHQPPVYYLPSFSMSNESGARMEAGGRFRLDHPSLVERGEWSWRMNPFVGTMPYQGMLVMMLLFANGDLKNSNNTLYEVTRDGAAEQWYVVRDLGASLGERGIFKPMRNDPGLFEQESFITGVANGFVQFDHPMKERMLVEGRITPAEVAWASNLLGRLTERQWRDAFRAGGYDNDVAGRFIRKIRQSITEGQRVTASTEAVSRTF